MPRRRGIHLDRPFKQFPSLGQETAVHLAPIAPPLLSCVPGKLDLCLREFQQCPRIGADYASRTFEITMRNLRFSESPSKNRGINGVMRRSGSRNFVQQLSRIINSFVSPQNLDPSVGYVARQGIRTARPEPAEYMFSGLKIVPLGAKLDHFRGENCGTFVPFPSISDTDECVFRAGNRSQVRGVLQCGDRCVLGMRRQCSPEPLTPFIKVEFRSRRSVPGH